MEYILQVRFQERDIGDIAFTGPAYVMSVPYPPFQSWLAIFILRFEPPITAGFNFVQGERGWRQPMMCCLRFCVSDFILANAVSIFFFTVGNRWRANNFFSIPSHQLSICTSQSQNTFWFNSTMSVECTNPIPILVLAVLTGPFGLI